jgi:hypothetical protein
LDDDPVGIGHLKSALAPRPADLSAGNPDRHAAGTARASAHDPRQAYAFGLDRTLDAIAVLVDAAR